MVSTAISSTPQVEPDSKQVVTLFNQVFIPAWSTCLVAGGEEPIYLPAEKEHDNHRIIFTRDYVSSAMHEIAHWCVAGAKRRTQVDFGYWYEPDGRSAEQQAQFEQVEVKPQALEWLFMNACGLRFRVSADNLESNMGASDVFKQRVVEQAQNYCEYGVNERALLWIKTLQQFYGTADVFTAEQYSLATVR